VLSRRYATASSRFAAYAGGVTALADAPASGSPCEVVVVTVAVLTDNEVVVNEAGALPEAAAPWCRAL
jgi:hypothetical protein